MLSDRLVDWVDSIGGLKKLIQYCPITGSHQISLCRIQRSRLSPKQSLVDDLVRKNWDCEQSTACWEENLSIGTSENI